MPHTQAIQWHRRTDPSEPTSSAVQLNALPVLALYIHLPWCVRKCPYCDFNSHENTPDIQQQSRYIQALINDLDASLPEVWGRRLVSIFIGGGTPSVFSPESIDTLLCAVRARLPQVSEIEITLEANPGTWDAAKWQGYRDAGVTRLSLGIQSFDDQALERIGRIHNSTEAKKAITAALTIFPAVNLDMMYALPHQSLAQLQQDVQTALSFAPQHLSYYHLTIEPNTYFHRYPPTIADDELATDMQDYIETALAQAGLRQYEISAYARAGYECQHNTNYWQFGDYLGIGAGAHGKISRHDGITRTAKYRHPERYMDAQNKTEITTTVTRQELPFEYTLNALRLKKGVRFSQMQASCGLTPVDLEPALSQAIQRGWLSSEQGTLCTTEQGWRYLSDVQMLFLAD